jgi:hypothetical protein
MNIIKVSCLLFSVCICNHLSAGVFDDVKLWWHIDYDANSDGIVQVDELRDQTDWGTLATPGENGHHALNLATPDTINWTNNVPITSGGLPYGDMAIEFQPVTNMYVSSYTTNVVEVISTNEFSEVITNQVDVVTTNYTKVCWPQTIKVQNTAVKSNCTILCRFRWDGPAMDEWNEPGWIVNNALSYSNWLGWMFGVRRSGSSYYLGMYIGQEAQYYYNVPLIRGTWYEAGAILRDNGSEDTVTFYLWPEDYWEVESSQNELSGLTWHTYNSTHITNYISSTDIIVGGESQYTSLGSGQNATKSFRGALNYLAMWDRDLSHNEMLEAFGYHTSLVTIGLNDDSYNELIIESEASSVYDVGDPWHTMPRAVSSTYPCTIRANLTDLQAQQNYVLHIDTLSTDDSLAAEIVLIVNSTTNETISAMPGQQLFWDIPIEQLASGINTFTIRYVGGEATWLSWDWIEIFGSWQVGLDDGTQADFVQESKYSPDYFLSDPVWKNCRRAVTSGHNVQLNFTLSQEMLTRHIFTYSTEIISQGNSTGYPTPPHPISLTINGNTITNDMEVSNNTKVTFPGITEYLTSGNNTISWSITSAGGMWSQFDYHKVEMALPPGPPVGTVIIIH